MGDRTFKIPIENGNSSFLMTSTYKEKTKENLKFVFSTNQGERVISPIGSNFRKILFENETSDINKDIQNETNRIFQEYFPDLNLEKLNFTISDHILYIDINYSFNKILNSTDSLKLAIG